MNTEYDYNPVTFPECTCETTEIRRRVLSNGTNIYALQCISCGRQIRAIKNTSPEVRQLADVLPFDETLKDAWSEHRKEFYQTIQEKRATEQAQKQSAWWDTYNAYLQTPAWRLKRLAVLRRASGRCEGCAVQVATQVHHLTYDHMGNELLFELVAVCDACHHILHPDMDT